MCWPSTPDPPFTSDRDHEWKMNKQIEKQKKKSKKKNEETATSSDGSSHNKHTRPQESNNPAWDSEDDAPVMSRRISDDVGMAARRTQTAPTLT